MSLHTFCVWPGGYSTFHVWPGGLFIFGLVVILYFHVWPGGCLTLMVILL